MSLFSGEPQLEETNKVTDASTSQPLEVKIMICLGSITVLTTMFVLSFILLFASYVLQQCCVSCYYPFELELEEKVCVDSVCWSSLPLAGVDGAVRPVQRIYGEIQ